MNALNDRAINTLVLHMRFHAVMIVILCMAAVFFVVLPLFSPAMGWAESICSVFLGAACACAAALFVHLYKQANYERFLASWRHHPPTKYRYMTDDELRDIIRKNEEIGEARKGR